MLTQDDLTVVGIYDGEEIEWINLTEYENHVKRRDEKGSVKKVKVVEEDSKEGKEEDVEEDANEEDVEEDSKEDVEDEDVLEMDEESSDEDDDLDNYNKEFLQSKNVSELKKLLDKMRIER